MTTTITAASSQAALAVIDLQNDFCKPSGALAVEGGRDTAPLINHLLSLPFALKFASRDFHPRDHVSFASQHPGKKPFVDSHIVTSPENKSEEQEITLFPDHCVQGTPGCEFIHELNASALDFIILKGQDKRMESWSAFGPPFVDPRVSMTGLDEALKKAGITKVFVCGLAWDYCVKSTAVHAVKHGFEAFVIEDATAAVDTSEEGHARARKGMEDAGVKIIRSDDRELLHLVQS